MSLLLLCLACATDDDTASFDSGASAAVETVAVTENTPAAMPAVVVPVVEERATVAVPAAGTATDEVPTAAACPIPAFAAPQLSPEVQLAAWVTRQGGLIGNGQHQMAYGETAWGIATQLGVPVWVLRTMNPHLDLDRLMVGDWLAYPVTQKNEKTAWTLYTEEECGC